MPLRVFRVREGRVRCHREAGVAFSADHGPKGLRQEVSVLCSPFVRVLVCVLCLLLHGRACCGDVRELVVATRAHVCSTLSSLQRPTELHRALRACQRLDLSVRAQHLQTVPRRQGAGGVTESAWHGGPARPGAGHAQKRAFAVMSLWLFVAVGPCGTCACACSVGQPLCCVRVTVCVSVGCDCD